MFILFFRSEPVHLNDLCFERVLCEWHISSDDHTQSDIQLDVQYLAGIIYDSAILFP